MTKIYLVRHGQSANNALAEHLRVPDPGLTEIGEQQAVALAAWFTSHAIDYLYCSPFLRALETVRPLAELSQFPVRVRGNLFELGGCYSGHETGQERGEPGMGKNQLQSGYPTWEIDTTIGEAGWWGREYETWEQGRARAASVALWLASDLAATRGTRLLVIHADFKRLLLEAIFSDAELDALQIDLAEIPLYNTGVSCLEHSPEGWLLREFNSTQHLPSKLVT